LHGGKSKHKSPHIEHLCDSVVKVNIFQNLTFTYSREQFISKRLWFILAEDEGDDGVINDNIFSELVIKVDGDFLTKPNTAKGHSFSALWCKRRFRQFLSSTTYALCAVEK
jgi:hypothetical protein